VYRILSLKNKYKLTDDIKGFFEDIKARIPAETMQKFSDAFTKLKDAWNAFKESKAAKAIGDFIKDLIALSDDVVITTLANAMNAFADAIDAVSKAFSGDWGGAFESYIKTMENLLKLFTDPFEKIKEIFKEKWFGKILDGLGVSPDAKEKFFGIGEFCAEGLFNGLTGGLYGIVKNAIDLFIGSVKELLGIHSPSTVFEGVGSMCAGGLVSHIARSLRRVETAVD
jgi:hypothetical protein